MKTIFAGLVALSIAASAGAQSPPAPSANVPPAPATTAPQATVPTALDPPALVRAARDIMADARFCAFITVGEDGRPQARTVDPFPPEGDMTVWVGTKDVTRKIAEVRRTGKATLYYFDPKRPGYVTFVGNAQVVDDPVQKAKHWKEAWASFYPNKNKGADYVLIRVKPVRLEIVDYRSGIQGDPKTWKPAEVVF